ncbi:MAG: winged helix-turn-helix domain-containing protein [Polyangiaceae bacterium]
MTEPADAPLHLLFGEFELSEKTFELKHRGQSVAVQPKVLDLLVYLARHRDRVVTKEELLANVWADTAVSEASLSQAVSAARRALSDSSTEPRILATVRGRGFRFVAPATVTDPLGRTHQDDRPAGPFALFHGEEAVRSAVDSKIPSTAVESSQAHGGTSREPFLFLVMRAEAPREGGAAVCLSEVDELTIERGEHRHLRRFQDGEKRCARLSLVGEAVSRKHARVVRTTDGFVLRDLDSSNGTWLAGKRVESALLADGSVFECGHNLIQFGHGLLERGIGPDVLSQGEQSLLPSVVPSLRALARDLGRIAPSATSVWFEGEHGVGKSTIAAALHQASGRSGRLVRHDSVSASSCGTDDWSARLQQAAGGSLLLENIDALEPSAALALAAALDAGSGGDVRLLATSRAAYADLLQRGSPPELLGRFSGYRVTVPALRQRIPDLGVLIAAIDDPGDPTELDAVTAFALCRHRWPGNVAELKACLSVARQMAGGAQVRLEHLPPAVRGL